MAAVFDSLDDADLVKLIKHGAVGVLPTDTIYGLVCKADNHESVKRLYRLKNRDHKPGTLIAANIEQLVSLGFKRRYLKAVEHLWPGAISIEIPTSEPHTAYLRQNQPTIAMRLPSDKKLQTLLSKTGPLITTSANHAGKEPATTVETAGLYFGGNVDFYVDGGNLKDRQPSTIIRVVDDEIEVMREGAVKIKNNKVVK